MRTYQRKHAALIQLCSVPAGAAIIIGMSQVRYIVGYRVPRADSLHETISLLIAGRAGFKWQVRP